MIARKLCENREGFVPSSTVSTFKNRFEYKSDGSSYRKVARE